MRSLYLSVLLICVAQLFAVGGQVVEHYAVELSDGVSTLEGFEIIGPVGYLPNTYVVRPSPLTSQSIEVSAQYLLSNFDVKWAQKQIPRKQYKRAIPVFADPLFGDQWHLINTGQKNGTVGRDIHVKGAWNLGYSGRGVRIAIVDDGFQHTHPDLTDAYRNESSHNYNDGNPLDPAPDTEYDYHGTSCAGVAMARNNSVCGVGAAYAAEGSGIRLISGPADDATEASALTFKYQENHIYSNSWGPSDDGLTLSGPGTLTTKALADGVKNGRGGLGAIYVWAAGNGLGSNDNCNYDGYANARETIAVGAIDNNGVQSYYSEPCAAMLVCAPSSSTNIGITTSDLLGNDGYSDTDCTDDFGGTSSACPLVAGVIALILEANPKLTWRDVQEILLSTTDVNDFADTDWTKNGAGRYVNHKYGFGRVNAEAAVKAAIVHKTLPQLQQFGSQLVHVNADIVDNNMTDPLTTSLSVKDSFKVEYVEVIVNISHTSAGDLTVILESPAGTQSVLAELHAIGEEGFLNLTTAAELFEAVYAQFSSSANVSGKVALAVDETFCTSPSTNATLCDGLAGNIALIWRGTCSFVDKVQYVQECGVIGVIVANNVEGPPFAMAGSGNTVPAVMVSDGTGTVFKHKIQDGEAVEVFIGHRTVKFPVSSYEGWKFSTVRNWGEYSDGNWTLKVADAYEGDVGVFHTWQLNIHGASTSSPTPAEPTKTSGVATKWVIVIAVSEAVVIGGIVAGIVIAYFKSKKQGYQKF